MPQAIWPLADRQAGQLERAVRAEVPEEMPEEAPAAVAAGGLWEQALRAPALLVEFDERVEGRQVAIRDRQSDLAGGFGTPELATDLVAFLVCGAEVLPNSVVSGR